MFISYCIKPNLGCPALVHYYAGDSFIDAEFSTNDTTHDLKNLLKSKLFLQFPSDTQKVVQQRVSSGSSPNLNIATWPEDITKRLIPIEVDSIGASITDPIEFSTMSFEDVGWDLYRDKVTTQFRYSVRLKILSQDLTYSGLPQIFNLVQKDDSGTYCRINYHCVYIHNKQWKDFSFLHISDTHIARRNDFIQTYIRTKTQNASAAPNYFNRNEQFRDFIKNANKLHRNGLVDFIVLTGDIVDFIWDFKHAPPHNNFEVFHHIVTGWPNCQGERSDYEELEVPIFTCAGNHDYRLNAYPLVGEVKISVGSILTPDVIANMPIIGDFTGGLIDLAVNVIVGVGETAYAILTLGLDKPSDPLEIHTVKAYKSFRISKEEAIKYQDNAYYFNQDAGLSFIRSRIDLDEIYRGLINPDFDQTIVLGNHRILCMNAGSDFGNPGDLLNFLWTDKFDSNPEYRNLKNEVPNGSGFKPSQINYIQDNTFYPISGLRILACHNPIVNRSNENDTEPSHFENQVFSEKVPQYPYFDYGTMHNFVFRIPSPGEIFELSMRHGFNNLEANPKLFVNLLYNNNGKKNIDLILCGHTHNDIQIKFSRDYEMFNGEKYYNFEGNLYSEDLSHQHDKRFWWQDKTPLQLQIPALFEDYKNDNNEPSVNEKRTFNMSRIVVHNDTITGINKLKINDSVSPPPLFVKNVVILGCSPEHKFIPNGFGKLSNNCSNLRTVYRASWNLESWRLNDHDIGRVFSNSKVPLSLSNDGVIFIRFNNGTDDYEDGKEAFELKVKIKNNSAHPILNIPMRKDFDESVNSEGTYYWGRFKLPESTNEQELSLEISAKDSYNQPLDSDPSSIAIVDSFSPYTGYEPGPDNNHRFIISKKIKDEITNHTCDSAFKGIMKLEPGQRLEIEGAFISQNEEDYYKVICTGEYIPAWQMHSRFFETDYNLSVKANMVDNWLDIPPNIDIKLYNKDCVQITPKYGKIDPFSKEFPDKIILLKISNSASYNCVGCLRYKLSVEFKLNAHMHFPSAQETDWFKHNIGIPNLFPDILVENQFDKSIEMAINKLKIIAIKGNVKDKKIAADILEDFGTLAKNLGLKDYATDLYKTSFNTFKNIGATDLAKKVNNELKQLQRYH